MALWEPQTRDASSHASLTAPVGIPGVSLPEIFRKT